MKVTNELIDLIVCAMYHRNNGLPFEAGSKECYDLFASAHPIWVDAARTTVSDFLADLDCAGLEVEVKFGSTKEGA